jgi:cyclic lactone autoinducer peptide
LKDQKNVSMKLGKGLAGLALKVTTYQANSACCWISHQPKLPEGAKKLQKFK